jgi:hypothetical protein
MATTPDQIWAKNYGTLVSTLAQQEGSRLRNTVTVKSGVVGEETYMDQIGAFDMVTRSARLDTTPISVAAYYRRKIGLTDYFVAKAIDKMDDIRTLGDPTSAIVRSGVNGAGRAIDDIIIAAATATAATGKVGGDSTAFPSAQKIAQGSTGMTLAKWLAALEILNANDVDPSDEKFLVIGSQQLSDLLNTTEIKNADYNSVKALVQGQIDTFLGCKVIRSERLGTVTTNVRKCLLYTKTGIGLAIGRDVMSNIDVLPGNHYAKQLYFSLSMGASRLEESKVVQIGCCES